MQASTHVFPESALPLAPSLLLTLASLPGLETRRKTGARTLRSQAYQLHSPHSDSLEDLKTRLPLSTVVL